MSVIQKIRDKAAWIIFGAIALALLAFIVQDAFYRKGSMSGGGTTLGKVNGETIEHDEFEHKISFYEQANGGQVQRTELIGNVWDYMVNQIVVKQEIDKLGIKVTSNELSDVLFGNNPPQWMQQAFTNPNTGQFDVNAAKKQFAALKSKTNDPQVANLYEGYINPTILQTMGEKYQSLIEGAVYIPKWMSEKINADNNSIAKASYVYIPYTIVSDSSVKVSDDEIKSYIKKHESQFKRDDETRTISYVTFSALPSADDSASVRNDLNQLKNEFAASIDEKNFVSARGSEMQFYNSLISRKEIKQKLSDSVYNITQGSVYGPYIDGGNYVLAKMVDKQTTPDSAKVRHILVATHQQDQSTGSLTRIRDDSAAMRRLDSAIDILHSGVSFDSVCLKYSDDPGSKENGGVYDYFPSGQMDEAFNDFSFTGKSGETKIVHTVFGYHYVEILGQRGSSEAYKIAYLAKPITASAATDNAANNAAAQFAANSRNDKELEANAKKQHLIVASAPEFKQNDFSVTGIGESRTLIKWAFENKLGSTSEPQNVGDKYIVAVITAINEKGIASPGTARQVVEPLVRNEKKAQLIIAQQIKGHTLEEVAKSAKQTIKTVDSVAFSAFVVPEIGNEPQFIGAAFNKQLQGKVSSVIAGNSGVFVLKGEGISGVSNVGLTPDMQKTQMEGQLKQQLSQEVMVLRKVATVDDYRSKFY